MAAVSTDLIQELEELVNCPICLETFSDPRILRCHHSFCMACLEAMLGHGVMLCCPCCKRNTKVPQGVRNLPKDFRANTWLDKLNEHHKRSKTKTTTKAIEKPERKHVQPARRHPNPAENCQVCDCALDVTDTKTFDCGHHMCRNCADFLTPAGGSIPQCPTCSNVSLPVTPPPTESRACSWEIPLPLSPTAPPSACQEESGATPQTTTSSDTSPQTASHPDTSPREVILKLQPSDSIAASSREDVVCPPPSAPPRVSSSEAIGAPLVSGDGATCAGAAITSSQSPLTPGTSLHQEDYSGDLCGCSGLTFHPVCGRNITVGARGTTALKRPKDVLVDAVVLTSRHLAPNEMFEVRLDKPGLKPGWSMEIGVTTYCPTADKFPECLYDLPSGTWSMLRSKVWHGKEIIKQYRKDLTNLKVGERVGVERRDNGDLHFYVNGVSLGVAANNIPPLVHGVIDLRWGFDKVTIMKTSGESSLDLAGLECVSWSLPQNNAKLSHKMRRAVPPSSFSADPNHSIHSVPTRRQAPTSACEQTTLPSTERSSCCILI